MSGSKPISFPLSEGKASRQAHADLPEGTFERELGKDGFFGPATMMYHRHPPTAWTSWEGPLRPRAFDLNITSPPPAGIWTAPVILHNASVSMRYWKTSGAMDDLARNADGDELLFVHRGAGHFYCDYGYLEIRQGDYVVIPRSTMWRLDTIGPAELLLFEATGASYRTPDRGLLGRHALYDEAILDTPKIDDAFKAQQTEKETRVLIKRQGAVSTVTYAFNPLDCVGWHGDLSVVRLNVADIRPVTSHRYHLPPSAHTTWVSNRFVICTFVPRPFETDPGALKVPFFHNNDDYDEVIFYHAGNFMSRDNIRAGMVTWHPCGFTHGPHPKALERMYETPATMADEVAVMMDARDALQMGAGASSTEFEPYALSWATSEPQKAPRPVRREPAE